jgi:hypothetical protein
MYGLQENLILMKEVGNWTEKCIDIEITSYKIPSLVPKRLARIFIFFLNVKSMPYLQSLNTIFLIKI